MYIHWALTGTLRDTVGILYIDNYLMRVSRVQARFFKTFSYPTRQSRVRYEKVLRKVHFVQYFQGFFSTWAETTGWARVFFPPCPKPVFLRTVFSRFYHGFPPWKKPANTVHGSLSSIFDTKGLSLWGLKISVNNKSQILFHVSLWNNSTILANFHQTES